MVGHLRRLGVGLFITALLALNTIPALTQSFPGLIATDRLLGRDTAGTGQVEPLTVGNGIEFTGSGGVRVDEDNAYEWTATHTFAVDITPDATDSAALGATGSQWSDVWLAEGGTVNFDAGDCILTQTGDVLATTGCTISIASLAAITLGTDTAGNYVAEVADGTGIDGTCASEGCTYTPTFDATEISSATWGAGAFTAFTFNAGVTDPVLTFGSNSLAISSAIVSVDQELNPDADGGADLGTTALSWDDLFLDTGATINFDAGDVLITHSANDLAFTGVTGDYSFDDTVGVTGNVTASVDVTATAGDVTSGDDIISGDDVLLSDAGVINFNAGDCTLTEGTNTLTIAGTCTLVTEALVTDGDNTRDLGSSTVGWNDIHFGPAGIINFDGGDVTITHAANDLAFAGVTGDYSFDDTVGVTGSVTASVDVTATTGDVTSGDDVSVGDDLLIAVNGVIDWGTGDCLLTNTASTLALTGACVLTSDSTLDLSGITTAT